MARRIPPRKVTYFEPVAPRLARNTVIESTFEVGRRFRCTMRIDCGQLDPGAVIRPEAGEWHLPLEVPPPRSSRFVSPLVLSRVHWVRPEFVAEVKFLDWTEDNLLRQVVYEGLREDKPVKEVRREVPHPKIDTAGDAGPGNKPPARR